jgi:hypothetical protein
VKAVRAGHDPNLASLTETSRSTKHSRSSSPLTLLETLLYGAAVSPQRPVVEHQNIGFFRSIYRLISSDRVGESDLSPSNPGLGLFKRPQSDGRWPSLHRLPTDWRSVDRPASALRPAPTRSLLRALLLPSTDPHPRFRKSQPHIRMRSFEQSNVNTVLRRRWRCDKARAILLRQSNPIQIPLHDVETKSVRVRGRAWEHTRTVDDSSYGQKPNLLFRLDS